PGQAKLDDPAELVHVRVMIDGAHERAADVVPAQHVQGGKLDLQKRLAAQDVIGSVLQTVELQVDLKPVAHGCQRFDEFLVSGQANAVGVNHHHGYRLVVGVANHAHQVGMK